jgi:hypothetical protein
MDPVGVVSLVIDVSKDLYTYYRAVRDCDTDIKELRTQLLLLHETASSLTRALNRDGLSAEDKSQVDLAFTKCEDAAKELKSVLERIRIDGVVATTALEKMKALGRKAVYPFKKSTVAGLSEDTESCQDALHLAISILQLNIGATTVEQLQNLDDKLVAGIAAIESGLKDLGLAHDAAKDEIVRHLLQNRKMLEEEGNRRKAMAIVESLKYPQMNDREWQVHAADDATLGDLFIGKESKRHPQILSLLAFLEGGSGLFWIQGKPASGKSTLMKYLLSRSNGSDKLWTSNDPKDAIIVSHFCWVAGSTTQRSQQGLLQSLLHQVLQSDLALVPTACPLQWRSLSDVPKWHEKELWGCLYAAVPASDRQFCFFVDGLDELQPERDHLTLSRALNRLGSFVNAKVIISSRPWTAFERTLNHDGKTLTMENNNRRAIIRYIRNELEMNTIDEAFTQVSWDCLYGLKSSCNQRHKHGEAHDLVRSIASRASGVFLWVALVMEAVCRHVALGCPVSVLHSYVQKLPSELEQYFQNMIFKRIHESMLSETAMALSIALLEDRRVCHYALLCNYIDSGQSWLTDPGFASNMPCVTITSDEVYKIAQKTFALLRGCCRDLLNCPPPSASMPAYNWHKFMSISIEFTHRTVFDYLHTPEMQVLISEHAPVHFKDPYFRNSLDVAVWRMIVTDPHEYGPYGPVNVWEELARCAIDLSDWASFENLETENIETENFETGIYSSHSLAQALEEVSLYHFECLRVPPVRFHRHQTLRRDCTVLSISLAMAGLFTFTDTVIAVAPHLIGSATSASILVDDLNDTLFQAGQHDKTSDVAIIRRLLQAGVDPNLESPSMTSQGERLVCLWRMFLEQLAETTYVFLPHTIHAVAVSKYGRPKDASDTRVIATKEEVYANPYIQDAIKTFIEFGAELKPEDVEMLTNCLPKSDGNNFNWPEFLTTYSQPGKQIELEENRRERLRRWRKDWLSEEDRKLLQNSSQAVPGAVAGRWSDWGKRPLDLTWTFNGIAHIPAMIDIFADH